jgi:hypothetical protein
MNKKRFITFGCSYPFGQGLPDCIGNSSKYAPGLYPSKYSFAALISKDLDMQNVNLSRPGSSNKEIAYKVNKFAFEKDDIVLLHWTHSERSCVLNSYEPSIIGPWCTDKKSKLFYKHFNTNEEIDFNNKILISWANYYLAQKVSKIINTKPFSFLSNVNIDFKSENVEFLNKTINDYTIDYGADDAHPGVKSHRDFAKYICNEIKEKYYNYFK